MSRRKHPGKPHKRDKGQFVAIPYAMIQHASFQSLSADARCILIQMHLGFHGNNNGQIAFSTRQAMQCIHSGSELAKRALDQLQATGFIVCHAQSSFTMKNRCQMGHLLTFGKKMTVPFQPPMVANMELMSDLM
ncbi:MAG: hypothetical protein EBT20_18350 [Alphaproteobacteria bacterium]|nr:hypothetical protein [Alphaproteobacteria bacterium]